MTRTSGSGLLIFCGRQVGASLLSWLLERGDDVSRVVASAESDTEIIALCKRAGVRFDVFDKALGAHLIAEGRRYDWLMSLWNSHVIPDGVLALADQRLNLHPSLVPHARGSDSTAWILRKGLPAGVSIIDITETLDGGGVYAQAPTDVSFPMRGADLHRRLQEEIVTLFKKAWPDINAGRLLPQRQEEGGSFFKRKETNADRLREATASATLEDFARWILAHDFHPGTTAEMEMDGQRYRLRLEVEKIA